MPQQAVELSRDYLAPAVDSIGKASERELLVRELRRDIQKVVSPAMGGIIIGHEMGRALGVDAIFLERPEGTFTLRRGFAIEPGQKVLLVEDVVTTGLSSREAMDAVRAEGGIVLAEAALVDRSGATLMM